MTTIDLVKISKLDREDYTSLRSRASRHLETLLQHAPNVLTKKKFGAETAATAAGDFEALMYEERPELDTTGEVRGLVLDYYALVAEAFGDINLLTRHWWVSQRLKHLESWQIATVRKLFGDNL